MIKLLFVAVTLVSFVLYRADKLKTTRLGNGEEFRHIPELINEQEKDSVARDIRNALVKPIKQDGASYNSWISMPSIIY